MLDTFNDVSGLCSILSFECIDRLQTWRAVLLGGVSPGWRMFDVYAPRDVDCVREVEEG